MNGAVNIPSISNFFSRIYSRSKKPKETHGRVIRIKDKNELIKKIKHQSMSLLFPLKRSSFTEKNA